MGFDFENLEPWDASTPSLLPVGDHDVTIDLAVSSRTRNGNPQIEIDASNVQGSRRDWIVYAEENGARKVVALFLAAGVPLPSQADQDASGQLSDECVARLVGRRARMIVRLEDSYKNPGTQEPRVKGWVACSPTGGRPAGLPTRSAAVDDDIPF